ncbi:MAG TPA: ATPase, T2SS/T4P/T4SS family [Fibrobacteraceae bacterium]|nr:ATPase, T2SS/T4P/T4SS family [Fibrobacteraceae bacterium]
MSQSKVKVGELLLRQGIIDEDQLNHALAEHKRTGILLGKILVRLGIVSEETLTAVLGQQMQFKERKRLGEILLERGFINQEQLDRALEVGKQQGERLGRVLIKLGYMSEDRLIEILSAQLEIPQVKLDNFNIDVEAAKYLPEQFCTQYRVMPLYVKDKTLTIAMADPSNLKALDHIKFKVPLEVDPVMSSERDILSAIERIYGALRQEQGYSDEATGGDLETLIAGASEEVDVVEEKTASDEMELSDEEGRQVAKIVTTLINTAVLKKASDIHLEPQEDCLKLRYRIDGELTVVSRIPGRLMAQVLSRIKLMAKMDIAEKRKPLDGRFTVRVNGKEVDLRVSSFPTTLRKRGTVEKIVMRILDPNAGQIPLNKMGFQESVFKEFIDSINLPNGIILVTGPTGSGKSTTLYSCIREINNDSINITTMEDPVELNLNNVNQGQINNQAGFSFAAGIRSILRQDPDVIMIGEMRDQETASMAVEAALTGHLVFSTLHTNDAAGAFPRLLEMGLEPFLVATAIKGVLAQRLVRRICPNCKEVFEVSKELRESLGLSKDAVFYRGKGCGKCDNTGYKGRLGIFEFLAPNEQIRQMIIRRASGDDIKREAMKAGMLTLRIDGMEKALQGLTTLEQVLAASEQDS